MGSKRSQPVNRPLKKAEFEIRHATRDAEKGWRDLLATAPNAAVDAWDFLTRTPQERSEKCHQLRGDLGHIHVGDTMLEQWQLEVTRGGRIWFAVAGSPDGRVAGIVFLIRVATGHPNETIKQYR